MSNDLVTLVDMLRWRRPAGSRTERRWIKEFILPLDVHRDKAGNLIKQIGDSNVIWSAHTDTVHRIGGEQRLLVQDYHVELADDRSNCLGADNTAGCWLLMELIKAGVPGTYIFHRGEEIGGIGSSFISDNHPELLEGKDIAIAFDRRGQTSIITHQWPGRTCSTAFAKSLATELSMGHKPDDGGSFTDTANYSHIVSECTNVSAGFYMEHSAHEGLDMTYLSELRSRLIDLDTSRLVVQRDPVDAYSETVNYSGYNSGMYQMQDEVDQWMWEQPQTLAGVLKKYPECAADVLEAYGLNAYDILTDIYKQTCGYVEVDVEFEDDDPAVYLSERKLG